MDTCEKRGLGPLQWLRFCSSSAGGVSSVSGQLTKISNALWHDKTNGDCLACMAFFFFFWLVWLIKVEIVLASPPEAEARSLQLPLCEHGKHRSALCG